MKHCAAADSSHAIACIGQLGQLVYEESKDNV